MRLVLPWMAATAVATSGPDYPFLDATERVDLNEAGVVHVVAETNAAIGRYEFEVDIEVQTRCTGNGPTQIRIVPDDPRLPPMEITDCPGAGRGTPDASTESTWKTFAARTIGDGGDFKCDDVGRCELGFSVDLLTAANAVEVTIDAKLTRHPDDPSTSWCASEDVNDFRPEDEVHVAVDRRN